MFEIPAWLLSWFYSFTNSYAAAIALIAVVVMALVTPLTLKSTKGMLEMQRLAPEMRRLQQQYRNDRTKLNEEMMKLYQEHKVNPMASCLPLLAQTPVFIIMFRILHDLTYQPSGGNEQMALAVMRAGGDTSGVVGFLPRYLSSSSELYQSLVRQTEMNSLGLDLSKSTYDMFGIDFARGLIYAAIVILLGCLYFLQQRMVAARATVNPSMSPAQQKIMQYLPVFFAVFQIFFLLGLVLYYIVQALLRIGQQAYITRRFYSHEESLGRQAQRAGERAREIAKDDGGGGGLFSQPKREPGESKSKAASPTPAGPAPSKRTTPPKNRPTPTSRGAAGRPTSSRPTSQSKRTKKR